MLSFQRTRMAPDSKDFQRLCMSNCHKQNLYLQQGTTTNRKFLRRPVLPQNVYISCSRNISRISNWKRKHYQHSVILLNRQSKPWTSIIKSTHILILTLKKITYNKVPNASRLFSGKPELTESLTLFQEWICCSPKLLLMVLVWLGELNVG